MVRVPEIAGTAVGMEGSGRCTASGVVTPATSPAGDGVDGAPSIADLEASETGTGFIKNVPGMVEETGFWQQVSQKNLVNTSLETSCT